MIVTSKEAEALVGWSVREKTLKGFGWLVSWADRGKGEKDRVARKREEFTGKGGEGTCTRKNSRRGERTELISFETKEIHA
jgi:hypothetical protein